MAEINYNDVLSRFDDLVARGIINYGPRKTVPLVHDGFAYEFHITASLLMKPQLEESFTIPEEMHPDKAMQRPVCFGPGSDIANSDPDLVIATIRNTHLLVVNKFSVFRPQLLLLTLDSYRRQHEPLDLEDFAVVCTTLASLNRPLFAIYNCSPAAGASRGHKHVQILPRPRQLFPDNPNFDPKVIPYWYFLRYLDGVDFESLEGHKKVFEIYKELLDEAERSLKQDLNALEGGRFPHNVVVVKEWIIVIPRRSNNFEGVTANAAGMMGSVWLMNDAQVDRWKQVGPTRVLAGLGLAKCD